MENAIINAKKDSQKKEDLLQCLNEDIESAEDDRLSKRSVAKVKSEHVSILSTRKSQTSETCIEESFLQNICTLDNNRIPKQIVCFDEIYIRRCLELIHVSALKASSDNMGVLSDSLSSRNISSGSTCDLGRFVIEFPLVAGTENVVVCPAGDSILGSITRSKSMLNILKSPLFRQLGSLDSDVNFGKTDLIGVGESSCSDFMGSPGGLCIGSSQKLQKDMMVQGDYRYASVPVHKRLVSLSSTNSTCSDLSSSSGTAALSQGMLQCTWNDGFPHYVFSVDDQREMYVANLLKVESPDDKILDYMYTFHSRSGRRKENDIHDKELDLVGKMKVSTSFTLCPNNTEIMETRFVLYGSIDNIAGEMQTSSHTLRKTKGLSKKVVDVFRASHSSKQRPSSKHGGTSAILENSSWEPFQDSSNNNLDTVSRSILSENHLPPNVELAAIIVKDHIHDNPKEAKIGGWGLKFLKKLGSRQFNASLEVSLPSSECRKRNSGDCSSSMDILIPADFHGGPRTRNGGPSSLIERWRSGGCCDCGGWDVGCPLTVLNARPPSKNAVSPQADIPSESKTFDLFIQGSKQGGAPIMKMVNIHDGLYYIHFQSTLSALQSFSIAAAIIHSRSPTLRPKVYRS